jgi:hypothetical protein
MTGPAIANTAVVPNVTVTTITVDSPDMPTDPNLPVPVEANFTHMPGMYTFAFVPSCIFSG